MPSPKKYRLDEISGSEFASLSAARSSSTDLLANVLTQKIHAMLRDRDLIIENGVILPAKVRKS
jgi:hypothetical protein